MGGLWQYVVGFLVLLALSITLIVLDLTKRIDVSRGFVPYPILFLAPAFFFYLLPFVLYFFVRINFQPRRPKKGALPEDSGVSKLLSARKTIRLGVFTSAVYYALYIIPLIFAAIFVFSRFAQYMASFPPGTNLFTVIVGNYFMHFLTGPVFFPVPLLLVLVFDAAPVFAYAMLLLFFASLCLTVLALSLNGTIRALRACGSAKKGRYILLCFLPFVNIFGLLRLSGFVKRGLSAANVTAPEGTG